MQRNQRTRIVVLGSGFAAISLVKRIDVKFYNVTLASPRNHFVFTPLLPSTTVGTVEFRSIIEPVRKVRKGIDFAQGSCTGIDIGNRRITCRSVDPDVSFTLDYDKLVIAVGAWNNTFDTPGVREHALFLKELSDARRIRERIVDRLERADIPGIEAAERDRLLHFVVVGGGPTGVEFAAELHDLLEEDLKRSYPEHLGHVKITLIEAAHNILNSFDQKLRSYTVEHFARQDIDVRLNSPVAEVRQDRIILKDGTEIPAGLVVWSTGYAPTSLVESLPFACDKAGRILIDDHLRVPDHPEILAMGDCANLAGSPLPQTAQVAMQQGKYLARELNREAKGRTASNFEFRNLGMLAYVGDKRALADIPNVSSNWHGLSTFIFWRSAYLTRLVSMKNKVLVVFDWLKTWLFGRDLSKF